MIMQVHIAGYDCVCKSNTIC